MLSQLLSFSDRFIPPSFKGNSGIVRTSRLLVLSILVIIFFSFIYLPVYLYLRDYWFGLGVLVFGICANALLLVLLYRGVRLKLLGNLFTITVFICFIAYILTSGGMLSPMLPWVVVIPISAFIYIDMVNGYRWSLISLFIVVLIAWVNTTGFITAPNYPKNWDVWLLGISIVGVTSYLVLVTVFYQVTNKLYMKELMKSNEEINDKTEKIESINFNLEGMVRARTADLEKLNEELDNFIYSTSHNLGGPLASILGLIGLVRQEFPFAQLEKKYLNKMEGQVYYLDGILQEIRNYSVNQRSGLNYTKFNFLQLYEEVLSELGYMANIHRIEFVPKIDRAGWLQTDRYRMKIVLLNLVSNAIAYHDYSKNRTFVTVGLAEDKNGVKVVVEDNGEGMDEDQVSQVYKMFYRGNLKSTGAGLGLYVVKGIVEKVGGKIIITSKEGIGTKFEVSIPHQGV